MPSLVGLRLLSASTNELRIWDVAAVVEGPLDAEALIFSEVLGGWMEIFHGQKMGS